MFEKSVLFAFVLGAALVVPATPVTAQTRSFDQGHVHVTTSTDPKRLDFAVSVPAGIDDVWDAFTTSAGMMSWLAPQAIVEPRPGGKWEVSFGPGSSTAGGTIVLLQPKTLLAVSAMAPDRFPTVRRERTTAVFSFEAAGPKTTTVRLAQTGWQQGAEWDKAFDYLATGNAQLLEALYHRFAAGRSPGSRHAPARRRPLRRGGSPRRLPNRFALWRNAGSSSLGLVPSRRSGTAAKPFGTA